MTPRRVLYFHYQSGAYGQSMLQMLERIDRSRYAPWVVLPGRGAMADELARRAIPATIVPVTDIARNRLTSVFTFPGDVSRGKRVIREVSPELVHIDSTTLDLAYAGIAARLCGVPVVWHIREVRPDNLKSRMIARLIRRCATHAVSITHAASAWLRPSLNGKLLVVHNGVDTERFSPHRQPSATVRSQLGLTAGLPAVGILCWLTPRKRVDDFIRAASVVLRSVDARFVVVGGEHRRYPTHLTDLRRLAQELGVDRKIRFAGHRTDIDEVIPCLDMVVSTSAVEPFGRTLIEAAACGKPVVATRVDGVPEAVVHGETGLLAEPGDVDGIAAAVLTLIEHPALAVRMGDRGRARVVARFSAEQVARRIEALYDDVIERADHQ